MGGRLRSTGRPPSSPCPLLCSRHLSASSLPGKRGLAGRQRCGNPLLPGRCAAMGRALFCSSHEDASLCSWERGSSLPRLSCPPWEAQATAQPSSLCGGGSAWQPAGAGPKSYSEWADERRWPPLPPPASRPVTFPFLLSSVEL